MRKPSGHLCIILLVVGVLYGCSINGSNEDNQEADTDATTSPVRVNSTYQGTWDSSLSAHEGPAVAELTQNTTIVTGQVAFDGSLCFLTGHFTGVLAGHQLDGNMTFETGTQADIEGTISENNLTFTGTYTVTSGACTNDHGTFSLARSIPESGANDGGTESDSTRTCCKYCSIGKACGDSCISREFMCHQPAGCACDI